MREKSRMDPALLEKIRSGEYLQPEEMVDLMRYCRSRMAQGEVLEDILNDLGIDPGKSLIVE